MCLHNELHVANTKDFRQFIDSVQSVILGTTRNCLWSQISFNSDHGNFMIYWLGFQKHGWGVTVNILVNDQLFLAKFKI